MRQVLAVLAAAVSLAAPVRAADFAQVSFMSGCWKTAPGVTPEYRECYTAPKAGMMQGSSQTIESGKTTFFEFSLVIEDRGEDRLPALHQGRPIGGLHPDETCGGRGGF